MPFYGKKYNLILMVINIYITLKFINANLKAKYSKLGIIRNTRRKRLSIFTYYDLVIYVFTIKGNRLQKNITLNSKTKTTYLLPYYCYVVLSLDDLFRSIRRCSSSMLLEQSMTTPCSMTLRSSRIFPGQEQLRSFSSAFFENVLRGI